MRGQVGTEYVFLVSLVFVLVASAVLQSFKDAEINLGLSAARLSCQELASRNSSLGCYILGYQVDERVQKVNVTPQITTAYAAYNKSELKNLTLYRWSQIYRPDAAPNYSSDCFRAAYFEYCVVFP